MTPTEFDFKVKIPGDSRLLGAIRQLSAHAAGYAHLTPAAGERFAAHVERATETALSAARLAPAPIEYRFTANADAIVVVFSCEVAPASPRPAPLATNGVTVEWATEGTRQVCRIRQPLTGA
jgi:hypothetical protein